MSDHSAIEWTDATWNPVTGCTKISPGCTHCYAERFAERFRGVPGHPYEQGFDLTLWPERLTLPLTWKEPRMIFVNSMSDLFHHDVPDRYIEDVFDVMRRARQHVFQLLTKRSNRLAAWSQGRPWPANVWAGVSVESQDYVWRARDLLRVPAAVRFLSIEPLLGPVSLETPLLRDLQWVIVGGESGPGARPMKPDWVRGLLEQCTRSRVKFFFKQWGAYTPDGQRVGKKAAGRLFEGRTWDDIPMPAGQSVSVLMR